ncbi:MAG: PKD domain-containing protein [Thermoplasmatota archaeon]
MKRKILTFLIVCILVSSLFFIPLEKTAGELTENNVKNDEITIIEDKDIKENKEVTDNRKNFDKNLNKQADHIKDEMTSFDLDINYPQILYPDITMGSHLTTISNQECNSIKSDSSSGLMSVEKNGTISTDETWTETNSPYWITGNLTIVDGVTLAIEPGVRVLFNGSYSIFVEGTLKANGESNNRILFGSSLTTPGIGTWNSIIYNTTGKGYLINCNISHPRNGVILNTDNNIQISGCNINNTEKHGIVSYTGEFEISDNNFNTTGWAVLIDIHYVGYSSVTIGDMILTGNRIDSSMGFHFQNMLYEDPTLNTSLNVGQTLIDNNTFMDLHDTGEGIGILLSNYTVTNMTGGQIWWGDIIVTNNTVNYTTSSVGAIGLFPFGPNILYNLTDVKADIGDIIFANNNLSTLNEGAYLSSWKTMEIFGESKVKCGMTYIGKNKYRVDDTAMTVDGTNIGHYIHDTSTIDMESTLILNNTVYGGDEGFSLYFEDIAVSMHGDSQVYIDDIMIHGNHINSTTQAIKFGMARIGKLEDNSYAEIGSVFIHENIVENSLDGIYIDRINKIGYYCSENSHLELDDIGVMNNTIGSSSQGIFIQDVSGLGLGLEDNAVVDVNSILLINNTIESDSIGIGLENFNDIGTNMNIYTPGSSRFSMDHLIVYDNKILSYNECIYFNNMDRWGVNLHYSSSVDMGGVIFYQNNMTSLNGDGLYLSSIEVRGRRLYDNATASFWDFMVHGNEVEALQGNGMNIVHLLSGSGNMLYNYSSTEVGNITFTSNDIRSNLTALKILDVKNIGNNLYGESIAILGDIIFESNDLNSTNKHGININGFYMNGYQMYNESIFEAGKISIDRNEIGAFRNGIKINLIEDIGSNLRDWSSVNFDGIEISDNHIVSDYTGIYLVRFTNIGYESKDKSTFSMGNYEVINNDVTSVYNHGLHLFEWTNIGHSLHDEAEVILGDFLFNSNNIRASNYYGIHVYDWTEWGSYLHGDSSVTMGNIQFNDNFIKAPSNYGIYITDISYMGYQMNTLDAGASSFSMKNCEINRNNITSGDDGLYLDNYEYWGQYMYNDSHATFGDILINDNWVDSGDDGLYIDEIEYMAYYMYDNSSATFGHQEINSNTIYADHTGINVEYIFYENGYEMYGNSTAQFGHCEINGNNILEAGSDGIYVYEVYESGAYMYGNSSFSMENFEISYNNIRSHSDGIYVDYIEYLGYYLSDNSSATFGNFLFNNNNITSGYDGIYLYYIYALGYNLEDSSSFSMENFEVCNNTIDSTSDGIYLYYFEYFGEDIYGNSSATFGNFLFNHNTIKSGSYGMYIYDLYGIAYDMFDNSTFDIDNIEICYNTIESDNTGINIDNFDKIGSYLNGYSSATFGDFLFNHNVILTNKSGLNINFNEIGYSLYDDSELEIGDIEFSFNEIDAKETGISAELSNYAVNMYNTANVDINQIEIDENTINAGKTGIDFSMSDMAEIFGENFVSIPNVFYHSNTVDAGLYGLNHTVRNTPVHLSSSARFNLNTVSLTSSVIEAGRRGVSFDWNGPHTLMMPKTFRISYSEIRSSGENSTGVYLDDLEDMYYVRIRYTDIDNFTDGIYLNNTIIERCRDSTITNTEGDSFILANKSEVTTIDTVFDQSNVTFMDYDSVLDVNWNTFIDVETKTGQPIPGAEVIVEDVFGSEVYNGTADENGEVDYVLCPDYEQNKTGLIMDYNDYSIYAAKSGLSNTKTVTVDETMDVTIVITDDVSPNVIDETTADPTTGEGLTIDVSVDDNLAVDDVYLEYYFETVSGTTSTINVSMDHISGDSYSYELTAPSDGLSVHYDASVKDTSGNWDSTGMVSLAISDNDDPTAEAGTDGTIGVGENFTFDGSSSSDNVGIVNYSWEFTYEGSTVMLYGETVQFQFDHLGEYTVTLTVTDDAGNKDTDDLLLTVIDDISPTADAGDDKGITVGYSAVFNASASSDNIGIENYTWSFTIDGEEIILTGELAEYTFDTVGEYDVVLWVEDAAGNNDTDTMMVTVVDDVPPTADAGPDQNIGIGDTVELNASGSSDNVGIVNYTWSFMYDGEEIELYGETVSYTFDIIGTYSVQLSVIDAAGNNDTDTVMIEVIDDVPPTADAGSDQTVDARDEVMLDGTGSSDNVGIENYTWFFIYDGEEVMLYGVAPSFIFEIPGEYEVTLNCYDAEGNKGTDSVIITVVDDVDPTADAGDDVTVELGDTVNFDGSGSSDDVRISVYTWTFTVDGVDEELTGMTPTYQFDTVGEYIVTLTVSDEAGNIDTDTMAVEVVHSMDDYDGDGIPNSWEEEHGLDPWDPSDAGSDLDDDGLDNLEEYQEGTDPNNPDTDGDGLDDGEDDEPLIKQKDEDKDEDGGMMDWLLPIIGILIIIVTIIALIVWKRKPGEGLEEEETEEFEEEFGEEEFAEEGTSEENFDEDSTESGFESIEDEDMEEEL